MARDKKEELIIFTDTECNPCQLLHDLLKGRDDVRFIDINDPEAQAYLQGDEAIVPVAYTKGKFCAVESSEEGIALKCGDEGEKIRLCHIKKEGDDHFIDCGDGWRNLKEFDPPQPG